MSEAKKLQPEVDKKYSVIKGFGIGECQFKGQTLHLDQLSVEEADALVKQGFNVLVPKVGTATPTKG